MAKKFTIYSLIDPFTEEVRYVGCTSMSMPDRMKIHIYDARNGKNNKRKQEWIKSLLGRDSRPKFKVLEVVPEHEWEDAERRWISLYKDQGADLVNRTIGGLGQHGCVASNETRDKHRILMTGKKLSAETIAKCSQKLRDRWAAKEDRSFSQEYRDHMSSVHPRTHWDKCSNGHLFTKENTYWTIRKETGRKRRHCIACRRIASAASSRRRRAR